MNRGLHVLFALWLAVALILAPLGVVRAAPCGFGSATAVLSMVHDHGAGMVHSSGHATHQRTANDLAFGHCAAGHVCCTVVCSGAAMAVDTIAPVVAKTTLVAPQPAETLMPEGIGSVPPLGPPRFTI